MYAKLLENAKKFDLLGLEINLQIDGLKTYNTFPGLFFTIILMTFLLYSFVQMINDIQNGANPTTQKTSQYLKQDEGFAFPGSTFAFIVYIGDSNGQFILNTPQKTYYTLQFRHRIFAVPPKVTQLDFGKCSDEIVNRLEASGAVQVPGSYVYCLDKEILYKDGSINITNSFQLANMTRYQFQIYRCINSTTANYVCASNEEIDSKLQNAVITYSYPTYEFNALNFTNPYQLKVSIHQMTINTQIVKIANLVYKFSQSYTQQNAFYFFPSMKYHSGIEYYETYLDMLVGNSGYLGGIQISLDDMKFVYHRQYQNIFNIFGTLGGTYSVLKTILLLLLQPLQKLSFSTIMFNKISGKKKHLRIINYFTSAKQRQVIQEQYNIIQKAIEFDSYLEMMLKFENEILTFRSDRLVSANPDLFKSQKIQSQINETEKLNENRISGLAQKLEQMIIIEQQNQEDDNLMIIQLNDIEFGLSNNNLLLYNLSNFNLNYIQDQHSIYNDAQYNQKCQETGHSRS
ncbi:hypothetical protein pb186bvf_010889 [Paramecium bursaria]